MLFGGLEAGAFGREPYGRFGADAGPALVYRRVALGATLGYRFGGFANNAHLIPTTLAAIVDGGPVGVHLTAWRGWRLGVEEPPTADGGARASGWEAGLHLGTMIAVGVLVRAEQEDGVDVTTAWLTLGPRRLRR